MTDRVLFVDDEPNVLNGIRRQLYKYKEVEIADSGEEGLQLVRESGPFAVVVSDMRMPGMNGAEFLGKVREISPDTVRIILSGQAELESAIAAVNAGQLFRFLTKPCQTEELWETVKAGIEQYRLVNIERELLEKTLHGAVNVLTEILGIINPAAFSRASRIRHYAEKIANSLGIQHNWQFDLAAMLSQIGCITLPGDTLVKIYAGQELCSEEKKLYRDHPKIGGRLLANIPRLENVADMIEGQCEPCKLEDLPDDLNKWDLKVVGSEILRIAAEYDQLVESGSAPKKSVESLKTVVPPQITAALKKLDTDNEQAEDQAEVKSVTVRDLIAGMVTDQELTTTNGLRLMSAGQEITESNIIRLRSMAEGVGIVEPFRVRISR